MILTKKHLHQTFCQKNVSVIELSIQMMMYTSALVKDFTILIALTRTEMFVLNVAAYYKLAKLSIKVYNLCNIFDVLDDDLIGKRRKVNDEEEEADV